MSTAKSIHWLFLRQKNGGAVFLWRRNKFFNFKKNLENMTLAPPVHDKYVSVVLAMRIVFCPTGTYRRGTPATIHDQHGRSLCLVLLYHFSLSTDEE
jgi:hypothetical protein